MDKAQLRLPTLNSAEKNSRNYNTDSMKQWSYEKSLSKPLHEELSIEVRDNIQMQCIVENDSNEADIGGMASREGSHTMESQVQQDPENIVDNSMSNDEISHRAAEYNLKHTLDSRGHEQEDSVSKTGTKFEK